MLFINKDLIEEQVLHQNIFKHILHSDTSIFLQNLKFTS